MDLGLTGKVALITGGSEGVGKGIALCLNREGAQVAICARRSDVLERAAAEIRAQTGGAVLAHPADATKPEDLEALVAKTTDLFGHIDILVNNAGRSAAKKGVGALVTFLVSEQARFITGTAINIDGGVSASTRQNRRHSGARQQRWQPGASVQVQLGHDRPGHVAQPT